MNPRTPVALTLTGRLTEAAAPPFARKKKDDDQDEAPRSDAPSEEDDGDGAGDEDAPRNDAPSDDEDTPRSDAPSDDEDEDDPDKKKRPPAKSGARTIAGRIVEYGVPGQPRGPWASVEFAAGSLEIPEDPTRVKLLRDHDERRTPIGKMTGVSHDETGTDAVFALGTHREATESLQLASEGIVDGLSVGVDALEWDDLEGGGARVTRARLREVSLLAVPAYIGAQTTAVTAQNGTDMTITPTATAPSAAAPLPGSADAPLRAAATTSGYVDRDGYSRTLPALVCGRERIDASDYIAASLEARLNANGAPFERVRRVLAAAGHETSDLVPGLLPQVIVGPILDQLNPLRPIWNSVSPRSMPSGSKTFSRQRVTQHTKTAAQAAERTDLVTQPMKVVLEEVEKTTHGGYVNISRQVIDWTSPGALDLVVRDLLANLMKDAETSASTALTTAAGAGDDLDFADPGAVNAAIYTAAAKVYGMRGNAPDRVWVSPDVWATLGSALDAHKRPLFPVLNPQNALGTLTPAQPAGGTGFGLRLVVGPQLATGSLIVGTSTAVEVYEDQRGTLQAVEPSVLGVQVAAYAYLASYAAFKDELVSFKAKKPSGGGS